MGKSSWWSSHNYDIPWRKPRLGWDEFRIQDGQKGFCVGNGWLLDNAHQSVVSGGTNTSSQCIQIVNHWASVSLYAAIQTRLQPTRPVDFLSSWLLLVLPLLPSMTLFANKPTILLVLLSAFRSMKRNTDDTGIFSSRLLSSRCYFILFFCVFP